MPVSVSDFRALEVQARLAPLFARSNYIADQLQQRDGRQEKHVIPGIGSLTVSSDTGSDVSPQSVSQDNLVLSRDRRLFSNINLDALDSDLNLEGVWDDAVAEQAVMQVRNAMDEDMAAHLLSRSGTVINDGSSPLTRQEIRLAKARLMDNDGAGQLAVFAHPFACAAMDTIAEFVPNFREAEMGNLGIPQVGSIYGMPVFETRSAPGPSTHQYASTAWAITGTDTLAVTLAESDASVHGFRVGQRVFFDTVTAGGDLGTAASPVTITAVSGATVTIGGQTDLTNGTATEAGTLTLADATALVVDLSHCYASILRRPTVRFVPDPDSSNTSLQVMAHFGRIARSGRVEAIYVDADSIQS